jgi:hypothetical protein
MTSTYNGMGDARLSIYGMGDVHAFMIKGDTPLVMRISLY